MDGILNVSKPAGKTSFDIVALVRRLSGERRVGHAGTLDPAATGVLPVCLGQGTRTVEFLMAGRKCYQAELELGVTTDTYDATGRITRQRDASNVSRGQVETALGPFRGVISQAPPAYSAVKYQGKPLYQYARSGTPVAPRSRPVTIYRLDLLDFQSPRVSIEVECGKGTYIRSLAYDLGEALGCGATLKSLVRTRCGPFDIRDAVPVPELVTAFHHGYWPRLVYPIDAVLCQWAALIVSQESGEKISQGQPLAAADIPLPPSEPRCRAYAADGRFLGVLQFHPESGQWQPEKIFPRLGSPLSGDTGAAGCCSCD